jgi:hypothetical protein
MVISATSNRHSCERLVDVLNDLVEACTLNEVPSFQCDNVSYAVLSPVAQVTPGTLLLDGGCTRSAAGTALNNMLQQFGAGTPPAQVICGLTISPLVQAPVATCDHTVGRLNAAVQAFYDGSFADCRFSSTSTTATQTVFTDTTPTSTTRTSTTFTATHTTTTTTSTVPCLDLITNGLSWRLFPGSSADCSFFDTNALCLVPNAATSVGLGGITATQACCTCGGGTRNASAVDVTTSSAPTTSRTPTLSTTSQTPMTSSTTSPSTFIELANVPSSLIFPNSQSGILPIRVRYSAAVVGTVKLIVVVRNQNVTQFTGFVSSVSTSDGQLSSTLARVGTIDLAVRLGSWTPTSPTYTVEVYILPSAGGWSERVAASLAAPFSVTRFELTTPQPTTLPFGPGVLVQLTSGTALTKASGRSVSFGITVQYAAVHLIGNVSLFVTVANQNFTSRGFGVQATLTSTTGQPSGLAPAGTVDLTVQMGSWSPVSSAYQLQVHILPAGVNWQERESSDAVGFELVGATTAPTPPPPACNDLSVGHTAWNNGVADDFGCSFFSGPADLCGADRGAPGLGLLTSSQACCGCGGGLSLGNHIAIQAAPVVIQRPTDGRFAINVTVQYSTYLPGPAHLYRVLLVIKNAADTVHSGYVTAVTLADGSMPDQLPAAGRLVLTAQLGSWTMPISGYTISAALLPTAGSWNDRLAVSTTSSFAVVDQLQSTVPLVQLLSVPQSILVPAGQSATLPLRVQYSAGANATMSTVRLIAVVRNTALPKRGYVTDVVVTGTSGYPSNLPSSGAINVEVQLGSWSPAHAGYEVYVALLPNSGSWNSRLATSSSTSFALVASAGAVFDSAASPSEGGTQNEAEREGAPASQGLLIGLEVAAVVALVVVGVVATVHMRRVRLVESVGVVTTFDSCDDARSTGWVAPPETAV